MRLKQIGSAGNKTRRYHERPNETSNTEVKETMKVAITAKRVVILMMTMALAVALVACSGAAGTPGPAGPPGEQGPPGTPAETPEPGDTPAGGPVPIQMIKATAPIIFNDDDKGMADTGPVEVMLAPYFYPTAGLTFMLDGDPPKPVNAEVMGDVLTVSIKSDADHMTHMVKVKASNAIDSEAITFDVRRNRPPMVAMHPATNVADAASAAKEPINIWVGTSKAVKLKPVDLAKADATCTAADMDCIPVALKWEHANPGPADQSSTTATEVDAYNSQAFFYDNAGNSLKLVPEKLTTSKATMLDVMGGDKVTLTGMKSTGDGSDDGDSEIAVSFVAMDDNGLRSTDTPVLTVKIDAAPKKNGAIGTRVIKASSMDRNVVVSDLRMYFNDDRQKGKGDTGAEDSLMYYAWSDSPGVALVSANPDNVMKVDMKSMLTDEDDVFAVTINAVDPGEAMITVRAVEEMDGTDGNIGNLKQWVDQTFKVVVQLN